MSMQRTPLGLVVCFVSLLSQVQLARAESEDRPNILWITAEDMSPVLGCYGDEYASTPHLDRFAKESVRYTKAFATAPVCSPSRSCLINGVYAPSQGTHNMRSASEIPDEFRGFPSFLREAGYYTSNNVKTDYNSASWEKIIAASWDESSATAHFRKRPKGRSFFSVFNLMTSHQSRSMVWPRERFVKEVQSRRSKDEIHDPAKAPLPPYYPDTPVVRRTVARFYDCVTAMDKEVGAILAQLEKDGLADDTIVFFYSDHGSGMPRHQRALLDSGMRVALMIRFPPKFQHLAPGPPGTVSDRLVSFVDFAPTVLELAGLDVPEFMQGEVFLGKDAAPPREYVFGHRDRVDEVIDLARSARDGRYLYIRNYMPHLGYNQPTAWPDLGEIRHELYRTARNGTMTPPQRHFAGPTRAVEELYDCREDPQNLVNLAKSEKHGKILERLRLAHAKHVRETRDLGFLPETDANYARGKRTLWKFARAGGGFDLDTLVRAAECVGVAGEPAFLAHLGNPNRSVRYWGAVGLSASPKISELAMRELEKSLGDLSATVRIESANVLVRHGRAKLALPVLGRALEHADLQVVLFAARTVELLVERAASLRPAMHRADERTRRIRPEETPATMVQVGEVDTAMFIGFSTQAFLKTEVGVKESIVWKASPWIDLFDGKSLDGWTARTKKPNDPRAEMKVEDGEIRLISKGANLWVTHREVFGDFELEAEAWMPEAYNSGLGFRCTSKGRMLGYQCEIDRGKSGSIYAIGKGWVWPKAPEERTRFREQTRGAFRDGEWNRFRVRAVGQRVQVWVNDVLASDVVDEKFADGVVAIQHHGKGDVHRFRKIRVRKLERVK